MKDRAETDGQKEAVIDALYVAWCKRPHLRLGQLIVNAVQPVPGVFYVEDFELVRLIERFAGSELTADQPAATPEPREAPEIEDWSNVESGPFNAADESLVSAYRSDHWGGSQ